MIQSLTEPHEFLMNNLYQKRIHLVGIKGTGMSTLAEWLSLSGAMVTGSDTAETFPTEKVLKSHGIKWNEGFSAENITADIDGVIYSAAYTQNNPEKEAAEKLNRPLCSYPEALGIISRRFEAAAVAGVHGKTSTTLLAALIARSVKIPAVVWAGSSLATLGDRALWHGGDRFLIAETCEYRNHFLHYAPKRILLTSIEWDHQDFFKTENAIYDTFCQFINLLPNGGECFFCVDDPGALSAVNEVRKIRSDIVFTEYGEKAAGDWKISAITENKGENRFMLPGFNEPFSLSVPGRHIVKNAVGAMALMASVASAAAIPIQQDFLQRAFNEFHGISRRSEFIGRALGVNIVDDYGHHPTAIRKTLDGFRSFYGAERIIVDFMPHTYSRTQALLSEFSTCFSAADGIILHDIYGSAREEKGDFTGRDFYNRIAKSHREVFYVEDHSNAVDLCLDILRPGDLFVTMGAGDNWKLGRRVLACLKEKESAT